MGTGQGGQAGPYAPGVAPNPHQQPAGNGSYGGTGVPAGFEGMASPYYQSTGAGKSSAEVSRTTFNLTLALRITAAVLSLISFSVVASASKEGIYYTSSSRWILTSRALRTRSNKFLVAIGVIVFVYQLAQILLSCLERARAITFMSDYAGTLSTFLLDQVLAYLLFAAGAAAADQAAAYRHGDGTDKVKNCPADWNSFCVQWESGIAMGFCAFAPMAVLAYISVSRLNKHYNS